MRRLIRPIEWLGIVGVLMAAAGAVALGLGLAFWRETELWIVGAILLALGIAFAVISEWLPPRLAPRPPWSRLELGRPRDAAAEETEYRQ